MYIEERLEKLEKENLELKERILKLEEVILQRDEAIKKNTLSPLLKKIEIVKSEDISMLNKEEKNIREKKLLEESFYLKKAKQDSEVSRDTTEIDGEALEKRRTVKEEEVFEKLRAIRNELARAEGIPQFWILKNDSLKEMAITLPSDKWSLLEINGIGEVKFDKYGHIFLEAMRRIKCGEEIDIVQCIKTKKKKLRDPKGMKSHILTYELYADGEGLEDIVKRRSITPYTAVRELIQCKEEGFDVDLDILIEEEKRKLIIDTYNSLEKKGDNELKKALPRKIENYEIKIALYGIDNF